MSSVMFTLYLVGHALLIIYLIGYGITHYHEERDE